MVLNAYLDKVLDIWYESCDGVYSHHERKEDGRDDQGYKQSPPTQEIDQTIPSIFKKGLYHGRPECPVYSVARAIATLPTKIAMYHHMGTSL